MQRCVRRASLGLGALALVASCDSADAPNPGGAGSGGAATVGGSTASAGTSGHGGRGATSGNTTGGSNATAGSGGSVGGTSSNGGTSGTDATTGGQSGSSSEAGSSGEASSGAGGSSNAGVGGAAGAPAPISATDAAAAMGEGFNLGQMFENTQHPPTVAAASAKIDAYHAMGFRNVRVPVTWTEVTNGSTLVSDPAVGDVNLAHPRVAVISEVIDHALSKPDMYVVLNAHHEKALKTQSRSAVLERLWTDLAGLFADRDYRLVFEILNEPHRDDDSAMPAAELRDMTAKAYSKIRAADPARIVVIGGNQWFGAAEVPAVWTSLDGVGGGNDPYVMATFHHYNPWTFCGDNQGSYDDAWTDANLSEPMDTMLTWANSIGNGMPVYIGEWGVGWGSRYDALECNNIRSWYQKMHTEFAAPRGMPTAVWDDGGWFKIYDHATDTFANNLVDCISATCEWDGTERFNAGCE